MTDAQLEEKFRQQAVLALPAGQVEKAIAMCWKIGELEDAGALVRASVPA